MLCYPPKFQSSITGLYQLSTFNSLHPNDWFSSIGFFFPLQLMYLAFRCSRLTRHLSWLNRLIQKHLFSAALFAWSSAALFVLYVPTYQHRFALFLLQYHKKAVLYFPFILHLSPDHPDCHPSLPREFVYFLEKEDHWGRTCISVLVVIKTHLRRTCLTSF